MLTPPSEKQLPSDVDILREIQEIGIVPEGTQILTSTRQVLKNTFPVPDSCYAEESVTHIKALEEISNLHLIGRYAGRKWLQNEVLIDVFEQITRL